MSIIPIEETLAYINEARTNPKGFAKHIKTEIELFIDQRSMPLYHGCTYSTNQGKRAWIEAVAFLQKQEPLPPFKLNKGLCLACEDHAHDMAAHNFFGHDSSNGEGFSKRIERRCGKAYGSSGENIGNEFNVQGRNHALKTVMGLIIDDGVPSRGHRENIFSTDFKVIGIYSIGLNDKIATVMDFHSEDLQLVDSTKPKQSQVPSKPAYKPNEPPKVHSTFHHSTQETNPTWRHANKTQSYSSYSSQPNSLFQDKFMMKQPRKQISVDSVLMQIYTVLRDKEGRRGLFRSRPILTHPQQMGKLRK